MSIINKTNNIYNNVQSITLTNTTTLNYGMVLSSGSVNALSGGTTGLLTIPAGTNYIFNDFLFHFDDVTGLSGLITCSIGTNGPTFDNLMPSTILTGFNALNQIFLQRNGGTLPVCAPSDVVTINITVPAVGTSVYFSVLGFGVIMS